MHLSLTDYKSNKCVISTITHKIAIAANALGISMQAPTVCILYLQMNDLQTKFHLKAIEAI